MRNRVTNEKYKNKLFVKTYRNNRTEKWCSNCERYLAIASYDKQANGLKSQCKNCLKNRQKRIRINYKQEMVDYLGGKCQNCGYNKCLAALDFHHNDPRIKTITLSQRINNKPSEKTYLELDKCTLLCANCHRTVHYSG